MIKLNWKEAEEIAKNYQQQNKVTAIVFTNPFCDACNEIKRNLEPLEDENYQVIEVDDIEGMTFPPMDIPVAYIFVPNVPNYMPIHRVGSAPKEIVERDVARQKKGFLNGKDLDDLRTEENI